MTTSYIVKEDIKRAQSLVLTARSGKKTQLKETEEILATLRLVASYLETNPTEQFVKKERDRVSNRIYQIELLYSGWLPAEIFTSPKAKLKAYEKMHDIPKLREQLRVLDYILKV